MQKNGFTSYDNNITLKQLEQAQKLVDNITIIINHDYYTLIEEPKTQTQLTHHIIFKRTMTDD